MKVLVNGIGNIGKTLLGLLVQYKELLNISEIYALKNTQITDWIAADLDLLSQSGVVICTRQDSKYTPLESIINDIDYIFDCNSNSIGLANVEWYKSLSNLRGCSAQGSEKGFGIPYMIDINDSIIKEQKFVHIVSCNTHAIASLISTFTNDEYDNVLNGDFVIVRRSEDLGNHQRLVTANVVSRHLDSIKGTHHAIDVIDLFETKNITLGLQSSDITTPSQLLHTVRFNLLLNNLPNEAELNNLISNNSFVSMTSKFDSNTIFELGRRYSPQGRLYSHTIINNNNLLIDTSQKRIKGWAFVPQEGNTLLSTLNAYLLQCNLDQNKSKIRTITNDLVKKEW